MKFYSPEFFILLPLLAVAIYYYTKKNGKEASFIFSSDRLLKKIHHTPKEKIYKGLFILRFLVLFFMVFALARPRVPVEESKIQTEGIDIILAIDVSTSMRAEDFTLRGKRANRLEAVKDVVKNFIRGRQNDRIGIVVFAARAYTASPLTLDYGWLLENLQRIKTRMIEDGTAIGLGLVCALNRLKDSEAKSKIIILLTDGRNNAGDISPSLAAETAKTLGIKVYTIGAGTKGLAPYPVKDFFGNTVYQPVKIDLDEDTLMEIASKTGGRYFRATDTKSLRKIYAEIDKMEKTPIEETGYSEYRELFWIFLGIAFIFLLIEEVLKYTVLRKIP